jgi:site-specific DNA recombinase
MHAQRCRQLFGVHPEDVSRLLPLAFLSPRIVDAVLPGQQPVDLSVQHLTRNIELPIIRADHAKKLGI